MINHVLGLQLPFDYDMLLTPVVLTWYIATELGSILENAAEMGAPVPPVLRKCWRKYTRHLTAKTRRQAPDIKTNEPQMQMRPVARPVWPT